jgi:uncharacterized protein (TIGR03790 family)
MRFARLITILLLCLGLPGAAMALSADELLLIVNKNEPHSVELAHFYAQQRQVPNGRIVALEVPAADDLSFEQFEAAVRTPILKHLRDNGLDAKVTCLVTFYGMPLRIGPPTQSPLEKAELEAVTERLGQAQQRLATTLQGIDAMATRLLPDGLPADLPPHPLGRAEALLNASARAADRLPDRSERRRAMGELLDLLETIAGDAGTIKRRRLNDVPPSTRPAGNKDSITLELELFEAQKQLASFLEDRSNPTARAEARKIGTRLGLPVELTVLQQQQQWLSPTNSNSALDSELALIRLPGYPRDQWLGNPFHHAASPTAGHQRALMVSRIDGPSVAVTRELIATSVATEARGLRGAVAIDVGFSIGQTNKAYAVYDQSLLDLAELVQDKTQLSMVLDRAKELMPLNRARNVALYCGWYSVGNYVPTSKFAKGAVGFHIASFELSSLRDPKNNGWCRGMLNDGAVATLGPVNEPFLHSFPLPNEFFPLLMTGKLTLAEAYWKTTTLTSWMQGLIGDPLYNPYKVRPALAVADLPETVRRVLDPAAPAAAATQPASGPTGGTPGEVGTMK